MKTHIMKKKKNIDKSKHTTQVWSYVNILWKQGQNICESDCLKTLNIIWLNNCFGSVARHRGFIAVQLLILFPNYHFLQGVTKTVQKSNFLEAEFFSYFYFFNSYLSWLTSLMSFPGFGAFLVSSVKDTD